MKVTDRDMALGMATLLHVSGETHYGVAIRAQENYDDGTCKAITITLPLHDALAFSRELERIINNVMQEEEIPAEDIIAVDGSNPNQPTADSPLEFRE
jgi:hypothetical protein